MMTLMECSLWLLVLLGILVFYLLAYALDKTDYGKEISQEKKRYLKFVVAIVAAGLTGILGVYSAVIDWLTPGIQIGNKSFLFSLLLLCFLGKQLLDIKKLSKKKGK